MSRLLALLFIISNVAHSQKVIVNEGVTIKAINVSPSYITRTSLYAYQLTIYAKDSLWGMNIGTENGGIKCFSISHDEQLIALGTYYGYVEIWEIKTGERLLAHKLHTSQVNDIKFTPDDKIVVSCDNDGFIKISNRKLDVIKQMEVGINVNALELDALGSILYSGDHRGNIISWNMSTGKMIKMIKAHTSYIFDLTFHPPTQHLFSSSHDTTIKMWNIQTSQLLQTLEGHDRAVFSIDIDDNGMRLASGGMDKTVRLWNIATGKEIDCYRGHEDYVMVVRFAPGNTILSGSRDFTMRSWKY